jgi:hypothetical protein
MKAITAALGDAIDLLVLEEGEFNDVLLKEIASEVSEKVALASSESDQF